MSLRTRMTLVVAALVAAAAAVVLGAAPAQAATYRYWTYWWGDHTSTAHTGWLFARIGPTGQAVNDQSVIGWRFATTASAGTTTPRYYSSYADIATKAGTCPTSQPANGDIRVAIVVDYGSTSDWPSSERPPLVDAVYSTCVVIPSGSKASDAMSAAHLSVREDNSGLICGINGFPATECAPVVSDPTPTATRTPAPSPTPSRTHATTTPGAGTSTTAAAVGPATSTSPTTTPRASTSASGAAASPGTTSGDVATPTPTPTPTESVLPATTEVPMAATVTAAASSAPWGAVGGVAVVAILASSAWWTSRRRRSA